jgi:putative peptidoglycan lipid II flippase
MSITVSALAAVSIAVPLRSSPYATAGIAVGSALGSYVNLAVLAGGLRRRLGPLYTPAMWHGTRRIVVASLTAALAGGAARLAHEAFAATWHVRVAALPVLGAFGVTYLVTAWWMGSAEAARWLRRPPRQRRTGNSAT